jgi:hypothetical protein
VLKDTYRIHHASLIAITTIFHAISFIQNRSQTMNTAGAAAYSVRVYMYTRLYAYIMLYYVNTVCIIRMHMRKHKKRLCQDHTMRSITLHKTSCINIHFQK